MNPKDLRDAIDVLYDARLRVVFHQPDVELHYPAWKLLHNAAIYLYQQIEVS
jgi:hypothetical protein